jgi:hypothetical protein
MSNTATTHTPVPRPLRLRAGELIAWNGPQPARLRVVTGMVWVTCANDGDDHFMTPGTSLALPPGARALIGAEQDVTISLEATRTPSTVMRGLLRAKAFMLTPSPVVPGRGRRVSGATK